MLAARRIRTALSLSLSVPSTRVEADFFGIEVDFLRIHDGHSAACGTALIFP
jgi:hypothetical protein